jgi:hypothetical protein
LDFGTTGRLRYSNLIRYDRQTETWWQQANGEAIAGRYAGSIASGRDVGSAAAYSRVLDEFGLSFEFVDGQILDRETGSEWNVLGQAVAGELMGKQLAPVVAINHFWFSWAAFKPETRVYQP